MRGPKTMRQALRNLERLGDRESRGHPALWLGAHVPSLDAESRQKAIVKAAEWEPDEAYRDAYHQWQAALGTLPSAAEEFEVVSAVIVGLAGSSPLETSVTLMHPYGAPVIPGSALKGLASAYARHRADLPADAKAVLFGRLEEAGFVTFPDAWWVPRSSASPLARDVMTPHHSAYYAGTGSPTDFDDPIPVPFVHARGRFLVAVICEDAEWRSFAMTLLSHALSDWGIGAKTAAGYGRLKRTRNPADEEAQVTAAYQALIARIRSDDPKSTGQQLAEAALGLADPRMRIEAMTALRDRFARAKMLSEKWMGGKPSRQWLRDFVAECDQLGAGEAKPAPHGSDGV